MVPRPAPRIRSLIVGFAAAAVTGLVALTPAPARAATPALVIVLDASGSMNEKAPNGRTRLAEAKQAVRTVIASLPAGAPVGLRVYGSEVGSGATEKAAGCRDSRQVVPVGPLDAAKFSAAVDGITARGWTPIGSALQQAANDAGGADEPTIVLVSDGQDTCGPPEPCAVARSLAAKGPSMRIHTVGFALGADAAARKQLECIAGAGKGTYRDATDAASLAEAVRAPAAVALRGFTARGAAVKGTTDPVAAPVLSADGRGYTDTLTPGQSKYYAVPVGAGQRLDAQATLGNPKPETVPADVCEGALDLDLLTPAAGEPLYEFTNRHEQFDGRTAVSVAARTSKPTAGTWPRLGGGDASGIWWLRVTAEQGNCSASRPLPAGPYSLQLSATARGGSPAAPVVAPVPVRGGTAATDAPLLTGATPAIDDIAPGETRWWRLDTRDGSEAHARVVLGGIPWTGEPCSASLKSRLLGSGLGSVSSDFDSFDGRDPEAQRVDSGTYGAIGSEGAPSSQRAGTWYLQVSLTQDTCSSGEAIPVRRYPVRVVAEVRDYVAPASASPSPNAAETAKAAKQDEGSGSPLLWVVLGAVVALGLMGLLVFVLTRVLRPKTAGDPGAGGLGAGVPVGGGPVGGPGVGAPVPPVPSAPPAPTAPPVSGPPVPPVTPPQPD